MISLKLITEHQVETLRRDIPQSGEVFLNLIKQAHIDFIPSVMIQVGHGYLHKVGTVLIHGLILSA